jgi:hypothetical protein
MFIARRFAKYAVNPFTCMNGDRMRKYFLFLSISTAVFSLCSGQSLSSFDIDAYRSFLNAHASMSSADLQKLYSAGTFSPTVSDIPQQPGYLDSIRTVYGLTRYEESLISEHGFVVSGRNIWSTVDMALYDIYIHDLPVFVSTDAMLHALHKSYDAMLRDVEVHYLIGQVDSLITSLHAQIPQLTDRYASIPEMTPMLRDVDLYLTVSRILLGSAASPFYVENVSTVDTLLQLINNEQPASIQLFGTSQRTIDFSQFTPRGHYTDYQPLRAYFQAMIWLGRTEFYLIAPESADSGPTPEDVLRQTIDAALINQAASMAGAYPRLDLIDRILCQFVGSSDNITLPNVHEIMTPIGAPEVSALLNPAYHSAFVDTLKSKTFVFQRINSQILMSDPMSPEQIQPAASFLLLGQRFVIDSYIQWNVVYDRIMYQGLKVPRILPSTLDILFALGNDAAAQLLTDELEYYHYGQNLAGLRYLVDSYDQAFWESSVYNGWLNSIRALNPPGDRSVFPPFMQTAAWWQEKMTTQLAAWAELRHDNLLYAKQPYTAGWICSYPRSYVEPIPSFYHAVGMLADSMFVGFTLPPFLSVPGLSRVSQYFRTMGAIMDTLEVIATKELNNTTFTAAETSFLAKMLTMSDSSMCGESPFDGWFPRLLYGDSFSPDQSTEMVVADVHTAPTDASGALVGWVLHGGIGPTNLAVIVASPPGGSPTAFVGPVLSYYEEVTTNFKRLTDKEWETAYAAAPASRPPLANLYASGPDGNSAGSGLSLITGIRDESRSAPLPAEATLWQNYPNPFNPSTTISFKTDTYGRVNLSVFDILGRKVTVLVNENLAPGKYLVKFDGKDLASGMYVYRLETGGKSVARSMMLVK